MIYFRGIGYAPNLGAKVQKYFDICKFICIVSRCFGCRWLPNLFFVFNYQQGLAWPIA